MALTKQDVEAIGNVVDSKLDTQLTAFESKIDGRFGTIGNMLGILEYRINQIQHDTRGLREQIQLLIIMLDNFIKMTIDYQKEFAILKAQVD